VLHVLGQLLYSRLNAACQLDELARPRIELLPLVEVYQQLMPQSLAALVLDVPGIVIHQRHFSAFAMSNYQKQKTTPPAIQVTKTKTIAEQQLMAGSKISKREYGHIASKKGFGNNLQCLN